jgi:hypothetical protein
MWAGERARATAHREKIARRGGDGGVRILQRSIKVLITQLRGGAVAVEDVQTVSGLKGDGLQRHEGNAGASPGPFIKLFIPFDLRISNNLIE